MVIPIIGRAEVERIYLTRSEFSPLLQTPKNMNHSLRGSSHLTGRFER